MARAISLSFLILSPHINPSSSQAPERPQTLTCQGIHRAPMPKNYLPRFMHPFSLLLRQQLHDNTESTEASSDRPESESSQSRVNSGLRDRGAKGLKRTKGKDYLAIKDCLEQIKDGVEQLSNCFKETSSIKENGESRDFPWHASNDQTWMSAALTDANFCIDGFSGRALGGKTKAMIKAKVLNLGQATSNALSLFNRFAARYRSHAIKP